MQTKAEAALLEVYKQLVDVSGEQGGRGLDTELWFQRWSSSLLLLCSAAFVHAGSLFVTSGIKSA